MEDLGLEKRHKDRLRRLANAVERQVEDQWFDLSSYHDYGVGPFDHNIIISSSSSVAFFKHTCGTTACLMGWAPSLLRAIEATPYKTRVKYEVEDLSTYNIATAGMKLFGLNRYQYDWLFLPDQYLAWPKDRQGAVARIRAFLSVGGDIDKVYDLEYTDYIRE